MLAAQDCDQLPRSQSHVFFPRSCFSSASSASSAVSAYFESVMNALSSLPLAEGFNVRFDVGCLDRMHGLRCRLIDALGDDFDALDCEHSRVLDAGVLAREPHYVGITRKVAGAERLACPPGLLQLQNLPFRTSHLIVDAIGEGVVGEDGFADEQQFHRDALLATSFGFEVRCDFIGLFRIQYASCSSCPTFAEPGCIH